MKIASWNVNSVRARLPNITAWLDAVRPDVLLMQEIKCQTPEFPAFEFQALGYQCHVVGQKSYNGVALLSRHPVSDVIEALSNPEGACDEQARYVEGTIQGVRIASLYLPNGNPIGTEKYEYKLAWMRRLKAHAQKMLGQDMPFVLGGDWNVLPEEMDVFDPNGWDQDALFHPLTRAAYREIVNLGLTEAFRALHPGEVAYTFWDYQGGAFQRNLGLRIDHFLLSPWVADRLNSCEIDPAPRALDKASDHVPIILTVT